jgi:hypothetical protein
MKVRMKAAALQIVFLTLPLRAQSTQIHTAVIPLPLDPDNRAIYRDFLAGYNNGSNTVLNVAQTTEGFLNNMPVSDEQKQCLSDSHITNLYSAVVHRFAPTDLPENRARLVDPEAHRNSDPEDNMRHGQSIEDSVRAGFAAGLFTFSEIVFDATHTHAAFQYSFVCGRLCGNGGIVLYDKLPDASSKPKWQRSTKVCGDWIS